MRIPGLELDLDRLPAPLPIWRASVDADAWQVAARAVAAAGGRLVALWGRTAASSDGGGFAVCAALRAAPTGSSGSTCALDAERRRYPDLARALSRARCACSAPPPTCSASSRSARATRGRGSTTAPGPRTGFPCTSSEAEVAAGARRERPVDYPFVRVDGDGVHEIPVGPVHAGIIEPGHFRFSVVGEKVLRLEERLGYTHKGIEKRFTELAPLDAPSPRRARLGRFDGRLRLGLLHGARSRPQAARSRRARAGCARCCSSASASPTTSATSARSATMPRWRSAWPSSRACARTGCACRRRPSATAC